MKQLKKSFFITSLILVCSISSAQQKWDMNTALMQNTYRLLGDKSKGTCFVIVHSINDTLRCNILVTATHILSNIESDSAIIVLRKKEEGKYIGVHHKFPIRIGSENIYYSHPDVDVSVMILPWPSIIKPEITITDYFLATDSILKRNHITPNFSVSFLGFPLGNVGNDNGFPILRSGFIASYPLYPTKTNPEFLIDAKVFQGNSGGPVYYSRVEFAGRVTQGDVRIIDHEMLIGMITKEKIVHEDIYNKDQRITQMDIAVAIHSSYIIETIDLLLESDFFKRIIESTRLKTTK